MECPYCAEDIKNNAIKCKHCGEWLEKITNHDVLKPPRRTETTPKPLYEKINKILRQVNIFIDIGETVAQPAHLPEEYYSEEYFKKKRCQKSARNYGSQDFWSLGWEKCTLL